jgi:hypothetical protein
VRGETDSTSRAGGDAFQADAVIVSGTNGNGSIRVAGQAFGASALGLAAQVMFTWPRPGLDRLTANALAGDDVVAASGLSADAIQFAADGGAGGDVWTGSPGLRRGTKPGIGFDPCVNGRFIDRALFRSYESAVRCFPGVRRESWPAHGSLGARLRKRILRAPGDVLARSKPGSK